MESPATPGRSVPAAIRCGGLLMHFDSRPYLMGILNTTPDSFSDGGQFADPKKAIDHALQMAAAGADLIDVGGESSRPGADPVDSDEEIQRVLPSIEAIVRYTTVPVSIDTTKSEVARAALQAGASMINDISAGLHDPAILSVAAEKEVPLVLMHMRGEPKTMQAGPIQYQDLMGEIAAHLEQATTRAVEAGVDAGRIIWDPGIGFGKGPEHNLIILNRLAELAEHGHPVLIGSSRKSFIGKVLGKEVEDRLYGTSATIAAAVLAGAHILRVHDVAEMRQVALMATAISRERLAGANSKQRGG